MPGRTYEKEERNEGQLELNLHSTSSRFRLDSPRQTGIIIIEHGASLHPILGLIRTEVLLHDDERVGFRSVESELCLLEEGDEVDRRKMTETPLAPDAVKDQTEPTA